jgi:hypothetical protein
VLLRLTDPERGNAWLPVAPCTAVDAGNRQLVLSSDRSGEPQIYRYDLRSGQSEQWTDGRNIHPHLFSLATRNRLVYIDGDRLMLLEKNAREVYRADSGWRIDASLDLDDRGRVAALTEKRAEMCRLRTMPLRTAGRAATLIELSQPIRRVAFRPRSDELMYVLEDSLHLIDRSGKNYRKLELPPGSIRDALWSADGSTLFYLHSPPGERRVDLRQYSVADRTESLVARTSQFVSLARNRDSSVFLGVGGSKGSPYLLLLVRAVQRELAIAEHAAEHPDDVVAFFSPDSQRVYYHANLQGRSAIYSIGLERFVEKTAEATDQ